MPHDLLRTGGEHGTTGLELIEAALERDGPLPEVRVDLPEGGAAEAAWMIVSRIGGPQGRVLVELRPGLRNDRRRRTEPYWAYGPALRISTLGRTRVVCGETVISGRWLANRTGQVLKYLATVRHRAVSADELAEHLWPNAGTRSVQGVRYFIHDLRERLEPDRAPRAESPFVQYSEGGYALDAARVQVDVDEFERAVVAGRAAWAAGNQIAAARWYKEANALYGGDFLADEPYAEWALTERDRLRTLAAEALRMLIASARDDGDLEEAATHLDRLAVLEPFDVDVHRELISVCLQRRRRTEALRRYMSLRHRLLGTFGEELDFTLADLTPAPDSAPVTPVPVARSGRRSPRLPAGMRASA
jgi:DNA-binding SARP family transcriptional activator